MTAPSDAGALTPLCLTHLPTPLAASRSTARCGGLLHVGCKPLKSRKSSTVLFPLLKIYAILSLVAADSYSPQAVTS